MNRLSESCTLIFKQFVALFVIPRRSKNVRSIVGQNSHQIDLAFPRTHTEPSVEVGPIKLEKRDERENEFRFAIEVLGVGHLISIDFITVGDQLRDFDVVFRPNDHEEVSYLEGDISVSPDFETHLYNLVIGIGGFLAMTLLGSTVPFYGALAIVTGLLFLVICVRSIKPVISTLARRLQKDDFVDTVSARGGGVAIGKNVYGDLIIKQGSDQPTNNS